MKFYQRAIVLLLLLVILTSLIASCSNTPAAPVVRHAGFEYSELDRDLSPQISSDKVTELVNGNNKFALEMYDWLIQSNDNLIFSPYSISMALAMAYAGAGGSTKTEMQSVLHFTLSDDGLHKAFNSLDLGLQQYVADAEELDGNFRLNVANAMFVRPGLVLQKPYLDTLMTNYGVGVGRLESVEQVNGWVEEQTEDRIKDILDEIPPLILAYLINAIYFYSDWDVQFDEDRTYDDDFNLLDGSKVSTPFMNKTFDIYYAEDEDDKWQAAGLPYVIDDVRMIMLLPNAGEFGNFESSLDTDKVSNILDQMYQTEVIVKIPKFEINSKAQLAGTLSDMGMPSAFRESNDAFPEIFEPFDLGDGNTCIDRVIHQAFIKVNESGTEAAAATVVEFVTNSMPMDPLRFIADRPFIYLIVDTSTNTILFMGRILDPSA